MTTTMTGRTDVDITDDQIKQSAAVKEAIERIENRGMKVTGIDVHYRVPGGGDWSGMDAPVDKLHPVSVVIHSVGTFEDTTK